VSGLPARARGERRGRGAGAGRRSAAQLSFLPHPSSPFLRPLRRHFLGAHFAEAGPDGNDIQFSNVPMIRMQYRLETLRGELELVRDAVAAGEAARRAAAAAEALARERHQEAPLHRSASVAAADPTLRRQAIVARPRATPAPPAPASGAAAAGGGGGGGGGGGVGALPAALSAARAVTAHAARALVQEEGGGGGGGGAAALLLASASAASAASAAAAPGGP